MFSVVTVFVDKVGKCLFSKHCGNYLANFLHVEFGPKFIYFYGCKMVILFSHRT